MTTETRYIASDRREFSSAASAGVPHETYLVRIGACLYFAHLRLGRWVSCTCGRVTNLETPDEITLCE